MSKHTPGPWSVSSQEEPSSVCCSKEIKSPTHDYGAFEHHEICTLDDGEYIVYNDDEEKKANARLIAAAPELLELTKLALGFIEVQILECRHHGDISGERDCKTAYAKARAVIEKA